MRKMRLVALVLVLSMVFLLSGCATLKSTESLAKGFTDVGKGVVKDAVGVWNALKRADEWMREHAW